MEQKQKLELFASILRSHFVLCSTAFMESAAVQAIVLPKLNGSLRLYSEFKEFLEARGVAQEPKKHRLPSRYVGIRVMITRDSLDVVREVSTKEGRFFITAAPAAAKVHEGFVKAMENWRRRNEAHLVLLPACAHVKALESQPTHYDASVLEMADHFATKYTINSNLVAMDLKILPQQRDPLFGMTEWGKDNLGTGTQSVIVASPRQRFETVPVSNTKHPRSIMSTGVCTIPSYQNNRIGAMAERDHVIGGIVVEVDSDGLFHSRHVQAYKDGSFIDIANSEEGQGALRYFSDGTIASVRAEAMVMGDVHSDLLDQKAWEATKEMARIAMPKLLIVHDLHDGQYSNPHEKGKLLTQATQRHKTLLADLQATKDTFDKIVDFADEIGAEVVIVHSNHDDFLVRDISSMEWRGDKASALTYARLMVRQLEQGDALQSFVDPNGRAMWLSDRDDFYAGGFLLTNHGHRGTKGSRGSLKQIQQYVYSVLGHSHQAQIINGSVQVGCLCQLQQGYNSGLQGWIHSNCFVFPERRFLHVAIIDGKWRAS